MNKITNGTEKQIQWAEEIRQEMLQKVDDYREKYEAACARSIERRGKKLNSDTPERRAAIDNLKAAIEAETNAVWFISNRGKAIERRSVAVFQETGRFGFGQMSL